MYEAYWFDQFQVVALLVRVRRVPLLQRRAAAVACSGSHCAGLPVLYCVLLKTKQAQCVGGVKGIRTTHECSFLAPSLDPRA